MKVNLGRLYGVLCALIVIAGQINAQETTDDTGNLVAWVNGTLVSIPNPNFADANLLMPDFIQKYGYPCEVHTYTTTDGYILTAHRIPYSPSSPASLNPKPVVILQHGLFSSSANWLINGPEKSLGFLLADMGYDIWMPNLRGNFYSRQHAWLNPNSTNGQTYWRFTFHEMGQYDLPKSIDYILGATGQPNLIYVGHSMGTTIFHVMMSLSPSYASKVKLNIEFAPVTYMSHCTTPLRVLSPLIINGITPEVLSLLGPGEFQPQNSTLNQLEVAACGPYVIPADLMCSSIYYITLGYDPQQFNQSQWPVHLSNYPAGSSTRVLLHYLQLINSGKFCQFDYGIVGNILKYGSLSPPNYNLAANTVPTAIYYAQADYYSSVTDALRTASETPNVVRLKLVEWALWTHADYSEAIDVVKYVYSDVFNLLENYTTM